MEQDKLVQIMMLAEEYARADIVTMRAVDRAAVRAETISDLASAFEDTKHGVSIDKISEKFGQDIADLVKAYR